MKYSMVHKPNTPKALIYYNYRQRPNFQNKVIFNGATGKPESTEWQNLNNIKVGVKVAISLC
jgi:hypothetical protein